MALDDAGQAVEDEWRHANAQAANLRHLLVQGAVAGQADRANADSSWAWRQAGLDGPRCRRLVRPFLFSVTPYRGVAFNNRVFCTGGGYADVFDLCDFPMRS